MPKNSRPRDIKGDVGRRLKAARMVVYDSVSKLSDDLGIPKTTWEGWEKGEKYPDPYHIKRFCDQTGFTTDYLYRGHLKGIEQDVQLRLLADNPDLLDEAPDVARSAKATARV